MSNKTVDALAKLRLLLQQEPSEKRRARIVAWGRKWAPKGDLSAAWEATTNPEVLLAVYGVTRDRRGLIRAACACARASSSQLLPGDRASLRAIAVAEAWTRGEASVDEVDSAARAVRVGELNESKALRRTVYAPAAARAAAWAVTAIGRARGVTPVGYAENAALNAAYAMEGPAKRARAYASLAELVRAELKCPSLAALLR